MEPVIKKSPYHHVMLMRDDKEIISFKVHSKVLRYSLIGGILLVGLGIAGTAFGIKSWQKNHTLRAKYESASTELADARLQLEQLSNLQSLIATCEFPVPVFKFNEIQLPPQRTEDAGVTMTELQAPGTATSNGQSSGKTAGNAPNDDVKNGVNSDVNAPPNNGTDQDFSEKEAAPKGEGLPATSENGNQADKNPADNNSPNGKSSDGESPDSKSPEGKSPDEESPNENSADEKTDANSNSPSVLPITHDASPVSINNLSSKTAGKNRIQMNFDLVTNKPDAFVRGETTYAIELADGTKHPITPNFLDDTRFAISRMKNFDLTATLPKDIKAQQIKTIIVRITLDSGAVFTSSYPFAQ